MRDTLTHGNRVFPVCWPVDRNRAWIGARQYRLNAAVVIHMEVGIDHSNDGLVCVLPKECKGVRGGSGKPACVYHNDPVIGFDKAEIRVTHKFGTVHTRSQLLETGNQSGLVRQNLGVNSLIGGRCDDLRKRGG